MNNEPFIFVKPHVAKCPEVVQYIKDRFAKSGIKLTMEFEVTGSEIAARGLVDKHYEVNAHAGMAEDAATLFLNEHGHEAFEKITGESWDTAIAGKRIFSGWSYMHQHKLDATHMDELWQGLHAQKIAGGYYVAVLPDHQGYLLNGFYPSVREAYTKDDVRLDCAVIQFDDDKLSWNDFRHHVIGATNPEKADPDSIRGELYRRSSEFGIEVSISDNVIHASASPFEALVEKNNWLNGHVDHDPLYDALSSKGITFERILELYHANPVVEIDGENETLVDALEDKSTRFVARFLLDHYAV